MPNKFNYMCIIQLLVYTLVFFRSIMFIKWNYITDRKPYRKDFTGSWYCNSSLGHPHHNHDEALRYSMYPCIQHFNSFKSYIKPHCQKFQSAIYHHFAIDSMYWPLCKVANTNIKPQGRADIDKGPLARQSWASCLVNCAQVYILLTHKLGYWKMKGEVKWLRASSF